MQNIYIPSLMRIDAITDEAPAVKTFRLTFLDQAQAQRFSFRPGQFGLYGVLGQGECTFCIASAPTRQGYIECTFRQVGKVTSALAALDVGAVIGFRGPYGNSFPLEDWAGKNLLFIAGGIALPPLRCVIWNALDWRDRLGDITILYGARTPADLVYKHELRDWQARGDLRVVTTVDPGGQTPDWTGSVGFVPAVLETIAPNSRDTIALVCGPPVMISRTMPVLTRLGFDPAQIYTTLENRMKCGVGHCGHCNVGPVLVCKDGPVFTYAQLLTLPQEY